MMLTRWHSHTMQALAGGSDGPPPNEVWYTAPAQATLYSSTNVVEHTYADGMGVIRYASRLATMPNTLRASAITDVVMPRAITAITNQAFRSCSRLALTEIPAAITTIGDQAFRDCSRLALAALPPRLRLLQAYLFSGCSALALTEIPAEVREIRGNAFRNCLSLREITFRGTPAAITADTVFFGCTNLSIIRVPWSEGAVANAPWGAPYATIIYDYTP